MVQQQPAVRQQGVQKQQHQEHQSLSISRACKPTPLKVSRVGMMQDHKRHAHSSRICACTHPRMRASAFTHPCTRTHTCSQTYVHRCTHKDTRTRKGICTRIYTCTRTHTYTPGNFRGFEKPTVRPQLIFFLGGSPSVDFRNSEEMCGCAAHYFPKCAVI